MSDYEYTVNKKSYSFYVFINRLIKYIDLVGTFAVVTTVTIIFLSLLSNVILRYILNESISWAYEIPSLLFPWMVAGGIIMAAARGKDISVTVISDLLPENLHRVLMVLIHTTIAAISIGIMVTGQNILMVSKFQRLPETGITQVWGYSSIYFAFSLVFVLCILHILTIFLTNISTKTSKEHASFS